MDVMTFQGPGFHLNVPTNWVVFSNPQFQAMFVAPPSPAGRANFGIALRPVSEGTELSQISTTARKMQEKDYPQFHVIHEGDYSTAGATGFERIYTWHNDQQDVDLHQRQVMFLTNGVLTTITATRENREDAATLDLIFGAMIESFEFNS